jgi:hypothetical protein
VAFSPTLLRGCNYLRGCKLARPVLVDLFRKTHAPVAGPLRAVESSRSVGADLYDEILAS